MTSWLWWGGVTAICLASSLLFVLWMYRARNKKWEDEE
jgi:hypothetical protein